MDKSLVGRRLDEYRVERLIGLGGMAHVYLGVDVRLKRQVAIKVIDPPFLTNSEYLMRFEREAQAIARLEHPHIVRLYRYGEVDGLLYMAMQYIEGSDLSTLLADRRQEKKFISPLQASQIIREVCLALDYAHSRGVIHRDVKPSNIMLDKQGHAFLTDFGLARLIGVGTQGRTFGSPHYMSPEQAISSATVVPQSDLYSVGVILYEMFAGRVPFDAASPADIAMLHMTEMPKPLRKWRPKISANIEEVVLKALAKNPNDRYPTGAILADMLDEASQVTVTRSPLASSTLAARSQSKRSSKSAAPPLPPVPAAVAAPGAVETSPSKSAEEAARLPRRRKFRRLLLVAILLLTVLGGVLLVNKGGDQSGHMVPPTLSGCQGDAACQDQDQDGVSDLEDACPTRPGPAVTNGCLYTGTVAASSNVNLRSGPSMSFNVLSIVKPGETVAILGRDPTGDWLRVRTIRRNPADEIEGWIAINLIKTETPISTFPTAIP